MDDKKKYSEYLNGRSCLGYLYRKLVLYPRLCKYLHGSTLDIGCGIGDMLKFKNSAVGVDINPHNVQICRNRGLNAAPMEVNHLSFLDETFDSVLLDNVIEHIDDPAPLLNEAYRVLKPGCFLLVGVPGLKGQNSDLDHKVYYDEESLKTLANSHKFHIIKQFYMPLFFKSIFLSRYMRQYCIYSLWVKK